MPRIVFSIYLWLFFLDGAFSFADDSLQSFGNWYFLTPFRSVMATVAFVAGLLLLPAFIISPRFPKRLLLPPIFFLIWTNECEGFPLNLEPLPHAGLVLSLIQFAGGAALLLFCREPGTLKPFHFALARPSFTWRNSLISSVVLGLSFAVFLPVFLLGQLVSGVSSYTSGYLKLHHDGLYLTERHFKKDDKEIRLISMMHVGRKDFYRDLSASLPSDSHGIVLLEGLTNNKNIKPPSLGYEKMAGTLGLASQSESEFTQTAKTQLAVQESGEKNTYRLEFRKADIDLSELQPKTLEFVDLVGAAYRSTNMKELMQAFTTLNKTFPDPNDMQGVIDDILLTRNDHLFSVIEESLEDYPVVLVPWGALHLPDIETRVLGLGFEETSSQERKVLSFW